MNIILIMTIILLIIVLVFFFNLLKRYLAYRKNELVDKIDVKSDLSFGLIGFVYSFLDTLGIGCFALTTATFKQFKLVNDRLIPGTLNVAYFIVIATEAFFFLSSVEVDTTTLLSMVGSAMLGALIGANVVSKLSLHKIRLGMGLSLMVVAVVMLLGILGLMPSGGTEIGLSGSKLFIGIIGNFILGALMTLGIGLYAPCMALIYTLGMSPLAAFPIMMASCAYLMPIASYSFMKEGAFDIKASFWITVFGVIGVVIAAIFVKSLPIYMLQWLVLVVILYTSVKMFIDIKKVDK